jgi:SAM-dependent methyltransferase
MTPMRLCPQCGAAEPIGEAEAVWPKGWSCPACQHEVPVSDGVPMFAPALADTLTGFNPRDFEMLAAVERDHFWFVPRNRLIVSLIARYFPSATSFLEIGCGTGMVLSGVASSKPWRRLTGSELHPTGLAEARARLGERATFVQMDARHIPARDAFDVIGAFDVVEHIAEDEKVLAAMRDAIAPGGGAVLTVPQHPFLWSDFDEKAHHARRYRRGELENKLEQAGMTIRFSGSYTYTLFPLMALSRLTQRRNATQDAEHAATPVEFRLPALLNNVVKAVLQAEVSLTLAGFRSPFGGSRVVVAAKR